MKRRTIFGLTASAILSVSLVAVAASVKQEKTIKTAGYTASSLPTTIDLNDTSTADIRSYYSSLNSLSTSERQGTNLLKNLKTILKNGQKYYSYESGTNIWRMYEITDRDWERSPASSTTYGTYNSSTNKITGYVYGNSASDSKNNPYIRAIYVNRNVTNQVTAWDDHNQDQWGINREHLWPKAEGFDEAGAGGARGDPFHLVAANGYANNIHSNYFYGYVNKNSSYTDCGTKYSNLSGNLLGKSKTVSGSNNVFEPQDSDKGDIARAIFYMVARYNYYSGSDSDGIDSNNPNLILTQSLSDWSSSGYTCSTSNSGKLGILTDLLAWHHADPVDEHEIHRNNLLYKNFTNNRNPFVDFPEWADFIWGTATYNGTTYQSYSSTPTGYATPSSDTLNGYNGASTDPTVNLVTVSPSSLSLDIKDGAASGNLSAEVSVSNGAATTVNWTISPTGKGVTVSANGNNVTVNAAANATIGQYAVTATSTADNTKTGECVVTVLDSSQGGGSGETEEFNGSVTAASGALSGWTASGTGSAYADGSVKFDSSGDNVYCRTLFTGDVSQNMISLSVTINGMINGTPTATNSYKVEAVDSSGNVLATETKTGADVYTTSYGDQTFSFNSNLSGCAGIKITYVTKGGGNWGIKSVSWSGTYGYEEQVPTLITATVDKDFVVGETITKSDITVKDDLDNTITDFDFDDYQFTYEDAASGGELTEKEFDIEYGDFETSLAVNVSREEYVYTTDTLTRSLIGVTSTSYADWTDKADKTTAKYTGNSAGTMSKDETIVESLQLRYNNNSGKYSGIVSTTSAGIIDRISFKWNSYNISGRYLSIYGKNSAYTSVSELYNSSTYGTLIGTVSVGTTTALEFNDDYEYIGILASNSIYLTEIKVFYRTSATNVANYIMYEDTNGQCTTKLDNAITFFEDLTSAQRSTFMTSDDYVISTARTRFNAWLANQGKSVSYINGDYIVNGNELMFDVIRTKSEDRATFIIISAIVGVLTVSGLYSVLRKKKGE